MVGQSCLLQSTSHVSLSTQDRVRHTCLPVWKAPSRSPFSFHALPTAHSPLSMLWGEVHLFVLHCCISASSVNTPKPRSHPRPTEPRQRVSRALSSFLSRQVPPVPAKLPLSGCRCPRLWLPDGQQNCADLNDNGPTARREQHYQEVWPGWRKGVPGGGSGWRTLSYSSPTTPAWALPAMLSHVTLMD